MCQSRPAKNKKSPHAFFRLSKPCANCPFRKTGGIELHPERLSGIIRDLLDNDHSAFYCHKTTHEDGFEDEDEDEGSGYRSNGREAMCAGAAAYLMKVGRPTVGMRIALMTHEVDADYWSRAEGLVLDEQDVKPSTKEC